MMYQIYGSKYAWYHSQPMSSSKRTLVSCHHTIIYVSNLFCSRQIILFKTYALCKSGLRDISCILPTLGFLASIAVSQIIFPQFLKILTQKKSFLLLPILDTEFTRDWCLTFHEHWVVVSNSVFVIETLFGNFMRSSKEVLTILLSMYLLVIPPRPIEKQHSFNSLKNIKNVKA